MAEAAKNNPAKGPEQGPRAPGEAPAERLPPHVWRRRERRPSSPEATDRRAVDAAEAARIRNRLSMPEQIEWLRDREGGGASTVESEDFLPPKAGGTPARGVFGVIGKVFKMLGNGIRNILVAVTGAVVVIRETGLWLYRQLTGGAPAKPDDKKKK